MYISTRVEELYQLLRTNVIVWAASYAETNSPHSLIELKEALDRLQKFEKQISRKAEEITFGLDKSSSQKKAKS